MKLFICLALLATSSSVEAHVVAHAMEPYFLNTSSTQGVLITDSTNEFMNAI